MTNLGKRLEHLERELEALAPVQASVVILGNLDGTASVDGIVYPSIEAAKAAHPSPSGLFIECRIVDARRTPETIAPAPAGLE